MTGPAAGGVGCRRRPRLFRAVDPGDSELSTDSYRIDYDNLDVVDLASQISARARRADDAAQYMPEAVRERARARVRAALDADDARAHVLQRELQLEGTWNVTPEDLVVSRRAGAGALLSATRRLLKPVLKLFANADLPLYKQFKINLGVADTLNELLCRNAELQARVESLSKRIEELEARPGASSGAERPD